MNHWYAILGANAIGIAKVTVVRVAVGQILGAEAVAALAGPAMHRGTCRVINAVAQVR
jgi:hypothetical protein